MAISKTFAFDAHKITITPQSPADPFAFGWITLFNGGGKVGFIYLESPPSAPHLSHDESYVVTSMP